MMDQFEWPGPQEALCEARAQDRVTGEMFFCMLRKNHVAQEHHWRETEVNVIRALDWSGDMDLVVMVGGAIQEAELTAVSVDIQPAGGWVNGKWVDDLSTVEGGDNMESDEQGELGESGQVEQTTTTETTVTEDTTPDVLDPAEEKRVEEPVEQTTTETTETTVTESP